jgi:molecular chaperone DnaK
VSAKDKATNKEQSIRIQASGGLSEADIQKMMKDAEEHAAEDKKRRETVDARNEAEHVVNWAEKSLREYGDKASDEEKAAVTQGIAELKEALASDDGEAIKAKVSTLQQAAMKIGEAMYRGAGGGSGGAGSGPGGGFGSRSEAPEGKGPSGDGVVDADFEEVKDDDKKKRA